MERNSLNLGGILLIDKPVGITSAAAVAAVKRALGGVKVGHLGTLDPFATGLLPLCIGEATKIAPYLNMADKQYRGILQLGIRTDTLDITGEIVASVTPPDPRELDLETLASSFTGEVAQVPPSFSAIKLAGVPAYRMARQGRPPEMAPRTVRIDVLRLEPLGQDRLALEVACSKGTYIRSLARDIGERLGCGAVLATLERTAFGRFRLGEALNLESACGPGALEALISPVAALSELRTLASDRDTTERLRRGQQQVLGRLARPAADGEVAAVVDGLGELVAVLRERNGHWRLERVFLQRDCCTP